MTAQRKLELRFVEYKVGNYFNAFKELLAIGKKSFLILGINQDAIEFVKKAQNDSPSNWFTFFASPEPSEMPCLKGIKLEFKIDDIEAIFIFNKDADLLSTNLMDYVGLTNCTIVAPVTEHYYKNRFIFIISPLKSGGHLLLKLVQDFGFYGPADINNLKGDGSFYFINNQDQHAEISILSPYHRPQKYLEAFFSQPALFLYRDPRDLAISLYHFLTKPPPQFLSRPGIPTLYHSLHPYFMALSSDQERLTKVIYGAPVINSIRDFVMAFAGWLEMPNVVPIKFEDLVGPKGGGIYDVQINTIWKLQLILHVPGKPEVFAERAFDENAPTFRKGQIGSYLEEFTEEHINLFKSIPQDFMEIYGYATEFKIVKPFILWFTGLPSSGKTTLSQALKKEFLLSSSKQLTVYDGDVVRKNISKDLGFSKKDRHTNNLRVAERALDVLEKGNAVCISLISPYRKTREVIRKKIHNFVEVYIKCPLEVCEQRDTKGMFKLAREGKVGNFTGIDDPYEEPVNPEIVVETDKQGIKACVDAILDRLAELGYIQIEKSAVKEKKQQYFSGTIANEIRIPVLVEESYKGFNFVFYKGKYFGVSQDLGIIDFIKIEESTITEYKNQGKCVIADSLIEAKRLVDEILYQAAQKEVGETKKGTESLTREISEREERIKQLITDTEERDRNLDLMRRTLEERDKRIEVLQKEIVDKSLRIDNLQQQVSERDGNIEGLNAELEIRDKRIEALSKDVSGINESVKRLIADIEDRNRDLNLMQGGLEERDKRIEVLESVVVENQSLNKKLSEELEHRDQRIEVLSKSLSDIDETRKRLVSDIEERDKSLNELRKELEDRYSMIEKLNRDVLEKQSIKEGLEDVIKAKESNEAKLQAELAGHDLTIREMREQLESYKTEISAIQSTLLFRLYNRFKKK